MSKTALVVLVLALWGCSGAAGTVDEAAELVADDGERVLREPMRPVRGAPRVLVLALDGVGQERLGRALAAGAMPRLSSLLGPPEGPGLWAHAAQARDVPSVFPSETASGWSAVFTGRSGAETGVVGNEWFARDSLRLYAPVPLSVETYEQTLAVFTDGLLNDVVRGPTLFERAGVRSHVASAFVYRGADLLTLPDPTEVGDLLEAAAEYVLGGPDGAFEEIDEDAAEGVEDGARTHGLPDLQVAYVPGVDLVAHASGVDAQVDYLRDVVDPLVGRLLDVYGAHGALDSTAVVVVSDHGHTDLIADDRRSLSAGGADEPPALLDSLGWRLHDPSVDADPSGADLVLVYNEAAATLYVADRSTCPSSGDACDWSAPPRLEADVLPLARALYRASRPGSGAPGGLDGALDLVLARASDPSGRTSPPFRVFDEDRLVPMGEYLEANPRPDLVRLEERLGWLTDGPLGHRAGDVLLLTKAGEGRPPDERFYFGPPQESGHGSATVSDSYVSLLLAQRGASGQALQERLRTALGEGPTQLDVAGLVLALLGVDGAGS